jgi:hypothetical protein
MERLHTSVRRTHERGSDERATADRATRVRWLPGERAEFHYLTTSLAGNLSNLDAVVDELESEVDTLQSQGFNRIGLPPRSSLLQPFILGSAGSLGGIDIDTRHPGVVFTVTNPGTTAVDSSQADSVFRFLDVPTSGDLVTQVEPLLGPSGTFLLVHQYGDVVSESVRDAFVSVAATLGTTVQTAPVTFDGSHFDPTALASARTQLLALVAGSIAVHIVNGALTAEYTTDALAADLFVDGAGVRHFAGNYYPSEPLPVALEYGQSLVWNPSRTTEALGLPTKYEDWVDDSTTQSVALYLEDYIWMATCGATDGLLDGFLEFDAGGTSIQFQIQRLYEAAGTTTAVTGERRSNPRWYTDQVPLDAALFDHYFASGFE